MKYQISHISAELWLLQGAIWISIVHAWYSVRMYVGVGMMVVPISHCVVADPHDHSIPPPQPNPRWFLFGFLFFFFSWQVVFTGALHATRCLPTILTSPKKKSERERKQRERKRVGLCTNTDIKLPG